MQETWRKLRHIKIKLLKIRDEGEKNLKNSQREKGTLLTEEKRWGWEQISHWKCCKQEDGGAMSLKHWEKNCYQSKISYPGKNLSQKTFCCHSITFYGIYKKRASRQIIIKVAGYKTDTQNCLSLV